MPFGFVVRFPVAALLLVSAVAAPGALAARPGAGQSAVTASRASRTQAGSAAPSSAGTLAGIDVLLAGGFAPLRGKRIGLLTNQTGRTRDGVTTIDALFGARDVTLAALFSPEHGIRGRADDKVPSSRDERTGLPIHSLYGETLRPTDEMLRGLDAVVVDLQDVGARFYTYPAAMAFVMEEAAKRRLPVFVLDRPNPVGGVEVEGPMQDSDAHRYTAYIRMPIRHGLTLGELARLFNEEARIGADLTVVPMENWRRGDWYDATGLPWINPSPNMRNLAAATLYPGIGAIEGTNISVGRGTSAPFEQIGAPWIDGVALASALNARALPGITFSPVSFTPEAGAVLGGQACRGVAMTVTDRARLHPVRVGVEIAAALWKRHGASFRLDAALSLLGSGNALARIRAGEDPASIANSWSDDEARWRRLRVKYLLY